MWNKPGVQFNPLGKTGVQVSALGFGAAPLGGVYGPVTQTEADRAVRAALDEGINFFDVSPYYGETRAETVLGNALHGIPRDSYVMATKVGRYGLSNFDFSYDRVTRSIDESLARLGVDVLDVAQVHDIEFGDLNQVRNEALPALRTARDMGKLRFIGVTGLPLYALDTIVQSEPLDVLLSYCHLHLSDTSLAGLAGYLTNSGVGIINASPLAMGLFSGRELPKWHPAPDKLKVASREVTALCRELGSDIAEVALRFALAEGERLGVATTLVGIGSEADARRNAAVTALGPPNTNLVRTLQVALHYVHGMTWASGRPENNGAILTDTQSAPDRTGG